MFNSTKQPMNTTNTFNRTVNLFNIWIISGIAFLAVGFGLFFAFNVTGPIRYITLILGLVSSATSFTSAWLDRRGSRIAGAYLLIAGITASGLALTILIDNQGLPIGLALMMIIISITSLTLDEGQNLNGIIFGVAVGVFAILIDQYLPNTGITTDQPYISIASGLISIVFLVLIIRQFGQFALRVKILLSFLSATVLPLAILGYINYTTTTTLLLDESEQQLKDLSSNAAENIDNYIQGKLNSIHTESRGISIVEYAQLDNLIRENSRKELNARLALLNNKRVDPIFTRSIAILDRTGKNILDTESTNVGNDEGFREYFKQAVLTNTPFVSNVIFYRDRASIFFSAPIKDENGKFLGVLREEVDARILQTFIRPLTEKSVDEAYQVSIIDRETFIRVGYTGDRERLFKSYQTFTDAEIAELRSSERIPTGNISAGEDPVVVNAIKIIEIQPSFDAYSISLNGIAFNVGTISNYQPWAIIARESRQAHLAPIVEQTRREILISIFLVASSIILALGATNVISAPIANLSRIAERISGGDFKVKAVVETEDEIGVLANTINTMTNELSQTLEGLEQRVSDRTNDLDQARQQSEKRSRELQAVGEISSIINSEQRTENLLPLITRLVSERFDFYHVGIFLIDETRQFAHLKAANSQGGQRMLVRGHRLEVGATGIVGNVTATGKPRIVLDVGADAVYFNNPDLPDTRSEMALPLIVRGTVTGALDVQSTKPNAFGESDIKVLSILSDQVATAIENALLFERTQDALNEVQAIYGQFLKEQWTVFSQEESQIGYYQKATGGQKVTEIIESDEIRQAMNLSRPVVINNSGENNIRPKLVIPIKLRGQAIGVVNVEPAREQYQWNQDEINLAEAISERLGLALENARLLEESQIRAAREQLIGEVASRIGASINMESVLQTAVEELGRALPGSEVVIRLEKTEDN